MKKTISTIITCIGIMLLSGSVLAQDETVEEPTAQDLRRERLEQRRSMTPEQRQAQREQARERFESLSEEEQARIQDRRQRMRSNRARRRNSAEDTEST